MEIIGYSLLLLFSFYALARIVDLFFVESLEFISKRLKLSSDIAGATFMAIGSSAPELFVSLLALFRISEQQSIGAGTIVGSAIFNILVIIGASALVRRATLTWQPVIRDLLFYVITIIIVYMTFSDGTITQFDALIFLGFYIFYLLSFKLWRKIFPYEIKDDAVQDIIDDIEKHQLDIHEEKLSIKNVFDKFLELLFFDLSHRPQLYILNFLISIALIAAFSHLMVESAVEVAHFFKIPEVVIGLTILAAGTSIPDLLSSMNVAKMGKGDMAIANAVGSNIFDICIGLGAPWLFIILLRKENILVDNENLTSSIILLCATVVALLFILIAKKWEIGRYAGILLIGAYVSYILVQIGLISFTFCINLLGNYCISL